MAPGHIRQNLGRNPSEKATKIIEQSFGLKRAENSKQGQVYQLKPIDIQKYSMEKRRPKGLSLTY